VDPHIRCLQLMKSASFQKLLRQSILPRRVTSEDCSAGGSSVAPDGAALTLEELNYQLHTSGAFHVANIIRIAVERCGCE